MKSTENLPHVVIVGCGFGGLSAARSLGNAAVRLTVVDRTNHHLFQPLLYQVATAGLAPDEIACPIRSILRHQENTNVLLAEVTSVDLKERLIRLNTDVISYDYLILAAGARTTYHGNPGWAQYAIGLKSIDDALAVRRRVLLAFEQAERETDPEIQQRLLTIVVIGGGPTGVEVAGSLAELTRFALAKDFRRIHPSSARIILVEGIHRILPQFPEHLSDLAEKKLARMGVEVRTRVAVNDIDAQGIRIDGEYIRSSTVLWCAGVAPVSITKTLGVELDPAGRVLVKDDLSIPGYRNAFAVGDLSSYLQNGHPLPGLAPVAIQQGRAASECILADLVGAARKNFRYVNHGMLATIGRAAAIADFGFVKLSGYSAWLSWIFIHILFLIGFRNKLIVMIDWIWSYLTCQRGARLITGLDSEAEAVQPLSSGFAQESQSLLQESHTAQQ